MMHTMTLVTEHEGTQEWICRECGRDLLVTFYPKFIVDEVEKGDEWAGHSAFGGTENAEVVNVG